MINLLPPEEKNRIQKEYKRRVLAVYLFFAGGALTIGLILLLPSYLLANVVERDAKAEVAALQNSSESSEREEINSKLLLTKERLRAITAEEDRMDLYTTIDRIAEQSPGSIELTSFSYTKGQGEDPSVLLLGGLADTREGLLSFTKTLEDDELFDEVILPVSSLAQDKDIEFSIEIRGIF